MRYEIETYDVVSEYESHWTVFATALSARGAVAVIRLLESWGYDRELSIYVRRVE